MHTTYLDQFLLRQAGGGPTTKRSCSGKIPRCPLLFLFFFVLFQSTFKIDIFVPNLVKSVFQKRTKKIMVFAFFDFFCSFNFFVGLVNKMSSNREQKRTGGGGANGEMANLTNEKGKFAIAIFRHFSPLFAIFRHW